MRCLRANMKFSLLLCLLMQDTPQRIMNTVASQGDNPPIYHSSRPRGSASTLSQLMPQLKATKAVYFQGHKCLLGSAFLFLASAWTERLLKRKLDFGRAPVTQKRWQSGERERRCRQYTDESNGPLFVAN